MDMLEEQNPSFPIETISPKDVVIVSLDHNAIWGAPATA